MGGELNPLEIDFFGFAAGSGSDARPRWDQKQPKVLTLLRSDTVSAWGPRGAENSNWKLEIRKRQKKLWAQLEKKKKKNLLRNEEKTWRASPKKNW